MDIAAENNAAARRGKGQTIPAHSNQWIYKLINLNLIAETLSYLDSLNFY